MSMNEKLFAHINADPFLVGSVGLEGNQCKRSEKYTYTTLVN